MGSTRGEAREAETREAVPTLGRTRSATREMGGALVAIEMVKELKLCMRPP